MESIQTLRGRRPQSSPAYAFNETLAALIAGGWRLLARGLEGALRARRNARARNQLHQLSDHMLRDIGLERGQIDRLFG